MKEDRMDELLIKGTRDYHEPGPVPREDMWARIEAERGGRDRDVALAPIRRRWGWAVGGFAAAAVLTVGIVIGRRLERASVPSTTVAAIPQPNRSSSPESGAAAARTQSESENLAYRLVMLRHLAGTEAMITAFRSAARRGEVDAQIGDWSRELLGTTRMLEVSPVTQDPTMRRLLEDLDLVLVQIAQYVTSGKHNPDDLDLIEQSINKRGVIIKLRSSLPARALPAGT